MKKILWLSIIVASIFAYACNPKVTKSEKKQDTLSAYYSKKLKIVQPLNTGGNDMVYVTFDEVLSELRASYHKIETIDKQVIDGKDTLQLHETYYCLHDSSLRVPARYMGPWGSAITKNFVANTFATKIIVIRNKDTVLNKVFKKEEFNKVLWNRLKQYAIIFTADYLGYDKTKGEFGIGYSITIPLTDVGLGAGIAVSKTGKYRILDEYSKTDSFKKD